MCVCVNRRRASMTTNTYHYRYYYIRVKLTTFIAFDRAFFTAHARGKFPRSTRK